MTVTGFEHLICFFLGHLGELTSTVLLIEQPLHSVLHYFYLKRIRL
jgi:hypothetical protein